MEFPPRTRRVSNGAGSSEEKISVAGRQRLDLFELQRGRTDAQAARTRLGHQHLGTGFVYVALAHHGAAGERRVELTRSRGADLHHCRTAATQVVEAVRTSDDDDLGVTHLAGEAGSVLDHARNPSRVSMISRRSTLPVGVVRSSSRKTTRSGVRDPRKLLRTCSRSTSGSGSIPAAGTTTATIAWPHCGSSTPTTATSRTWECSMSTSSSSAGAMFSPPRMMVSSLRPPINR